jgi:S-adenosylmethionine/arginine decarboxylase-like enzyme
MAWGYHLMLDCARCVPFSIRNKNNIALFSAALVNKINMVPYGPPSIQHFGTADKSGYTLVQLIETSNICAHFCEETDDMYLDVFSCKPYDYHDVEAVVKRFFQPQHMNRTFLTRQAHQTHGNSISSYELS